MDSYPKLFIPGPTYVPEHVMQSLTPPQIGHRTSEFSELMSTVVQGIQKVLYTKNHVYLVSHAATGLWEMGIQNSVKKGVLHAINGSFSLKWANVSKECGHETGVLEYDWGKGVKVEDVDEQLSSGKYDVFAMVHNETSTGVCSPLEPISEMMREKYPQAIWLVDAVSSMAGVKIETDTLCIDFLLSSTQKAWGLPAGFSVCAVSNRLIELSKSIPNKGYFMDINVYEKYYKKFQTPYTPSIPHLFGLNEVLNIIEEEGIDNRWERHKNMRNYIIAWAKDNGQELFSEEGCHSHTVSCINNTQNWDINRIYNKLLDSGYRMDRGYGNLRCKAFRIPHMGNVYMEDLIDYIKNLEKAIYV